jgi:hypothetical protein
MEDARDGVVKAGTCRSQARGYHHNRRLWGTDLHNHFPHMKSVCLLVEEGAAVVIHRQSLRGRLAFPWLQSILTQTALGLLASHTKRREERYYSENGECCQRSVRHTDSPAVEAVEEEYLSHCCWRTRGRAGCHLRAFDAGRSGIWFEEEVEEEQRHRSHRHRLRQRDCRRARRRLHGGLDSVVSVVRRDMAACSSECNGGDGVHDEGRRVKASLGDDGRKEERGR